MWDNFNDDMNSFELQEELKKFVNILIHLSC